MGEAPPRGLVMSEQSRIRILIADDHAVVRSGLAALLMFFEDLDLVGAASDGEEIVRLCFEIRPDVVLMDLVMPGMDGIQAISAIREKDPHVCILALTNFEDEALVRRAMGAGANGYLLKSISAMQLADAIRSAYAGEVIIAPEIARALISRSLGGEATTPENPYDLTDREREVLALLVEGLSNNDIATQLVISPATVKTHISNVFSKLGVTSRVEAVRLALERGLLPRHRPSG